MAASSKVVVTIILFLGAGVSQSVTDENTGKEASWKGLDTYQKALQKRPDLPEAHFGAGWEAYHGQDYPQAAKEFESAVRAENPVLKSKALYNLGNAWFKQGDFRQSLEAYRKALQIYPGDEDAKYNYELALSRLRQHPDENQSQPRGDSGEEEESEDREDKDAGESGKSGQNQTEEAQSEFSSENRPEGQTNAQAILDALEANEQNLMKRRWKEPGSVTLEKDW